MHEYFIFCTFVSLGLVIFSVDEKIAETLFDVLLFAILGFILAPLVALITVCVSLNKVKI